VLPEAHVNTLADGDKRTIDGTSRDVEVNGPQCFHCGTFPWLAVVLASVEVVTCLFIGLERMRDWSRRPAGRHG
jgi:hypothetical protein